MLTNYNNDLRPMQCYWSTFFQLLLAFSTGFSRANGIFQRALVELTGSRWRKRPFTTGFITANWLFQRALVQLTGFSTGFSRAHTQLAPVVSDTTGFTY